MSTCEYLLRLADKPNFDLNVKDGKLQNGAPVIVWQTQTAGMHNTWASEAGLCSAQLQQS